MRWAAVSIADVWQGSGEAVLLLDDNRVVTLGPGATALWNALGAGPMGIGVLVEAVEDALGPPPDGVDARELTEISLRELVQNGILREIAD
ncbi:hypothetical protein G7072_00135 [Nocardioides sp. HDW12B]|uniref:hypothetical protein n=1 Tax=Nocardioides sp. HDW12B TaxID=2714939 RepID=UPI0014080980|nr:hypothetical protein [Nocardioides sp. HDW12B]QIK64952.1 hypothetical protein G7072_00135 [Nocardioides sp. HDW12B]